MKWPWQARRGREEDHARADAAMERSREQLVEGSRLAEDARRRAARWRRWQEPDHFIEGFKFLRGQ